jgi:hypothetical protein
LMNLHPVMYRLPKWSLKELNDWLNTSFMWSYCLTPLLDWHGHTTPWRLLQARF